MDPFPHGADQIATYAWLKKNRFDDPQLKTFDAKTLLLMEKGDIVGSVMDGLRLWTLLNAAKKENARKKIAILLKHGEWCTFEADSLSGLRTHLGLPADVHVYATSDKSLQYMRVRSEETFSSLFPNNPGGYLYIKVGAVTPKGSPEPLVEENKIPFDVKAVRKCLFPNSEIAVLYRDQAVIDTVAWLSNDTVDGSVAMILAPPGSGKTRTPCSAAEELGMGYVRFKMSASEAMSVPNVGYQNVTELISRNETLVGASKERYKSIFLPLFREFARCWMEKASDMHKDGQEPVLLHLDEIQVFLPHTPLRDDDTPNIKDFILSALADVVNDITAKFTWVRVILTGTNFFSPLAIRLGSALKLYPISISGSFPIDWVRDTLLESEFPGLSASFSDENEWFESLLGFVSANRRCVQHLVTLLKNAVLADVVGNVHIFDKYVNDAYNLWKSPIFRALASSPSVHAIELSTFLHNNRKSGEVITLPRREVTQALLDFSQAGTLNLQLDADANKCHIRVPQGCILRFLNDLCYQSIPQEAQEELAAWACTSRYVDTNKGHYHERQLAAEGTIPTSTIYEVLSRKFGRTLLPVPGAVGKMFLPTPRIVELDWAHMGADEFRVHCVHDAAADVGHRLIDVAIPVLDEVQNKVVPVFFDVKDVFDECTNWKNADNTFTHPVLKGITYEHYLVFYSKHGFSHKEPQDRKVKEGNKSSAFCRREVIDLLKMDTNKHIGIIEGHELLCSQHTSLRAIAHSIKNVYVSDSPTKLCNSFRNLNPY